MKTCHLLATLACLLWIGSAVAAGPKPGRGVQQPNAEKPNAGQKFQAKAGHQGQGNLRGQILQEFDANGNGKLDPDEQAAARKAAFERRKAGKQHAHQGGGADPFNQPGMQPLNGQPMGGGAGGAHGHGRAKMMDRFDLNRDGLLSPQEEARACQMMQQHSMPQSMQQHGGPGMRGKNFPSMPGPQQGRARGPAGPQR